MTLPRIPVSTIDIHVSSLGKKVKFSRLRVMEEKILLLAKESGEQSDILNAIKQVIQNTLQDVTVDVERLPIFDIEAIFLKLHAASVSNVVKITIFDPETEERKEFSIDLNTVEIDESKKQSPDIKLSSDLAVHCVYPTAASYGDKTILESKDPVFETIVRGIDKIYEKENVYETKNETKEEISKWVSSLDYQSYQKLREFYEHSPSLHHTIKYTNKNGTEREYSLRSLNDFFQL